MQNFISKILVFCSLICVFEFGNAFGEELVLNNQVTFDVQEQEIPLEVYAKQRIFINEIDNLDVYKLTPSSYLLKTRHMVSDRIYKKIKHKRDLSSISKLIAKVSDESMVEFELIAAVIMVESGFRSEAVSVKGARGMMQLMPDTAVELGVSDPHDPYENIRAGATYLKKLILSQGSLDLALAAYNAGPGNVKKYHGIPPFEETQNFVVNVRYYYQKFKTEQQIN